MSEVVAAPSLKVSKAGLDEAYNLVKDVPAHGRGWDGMGWTLGSLPT